jgi:hypothetical protein
MSSKGPLEKPKEEFILFYSNNCGFSNKFIKLLQEYPELNSCFKRMEIEKMDPYKIPPELTYTPCVIVGGRKLIMGDQAFKWLQSNVSEYISTCTKNLASKGNISENFAFVGEPEDYNGLAKYGNENANNGTSIKPPHKNNDSVMTDNQMAMQMKTHLQQQREIQSQPIGRLGSQPVNGENFGRPNSGFVEQQLQQRNNQMSSYNNTDLNYQAIDNGRSQQSNSRELPDFLKPQVIKGGNKMDSSMYRSIESQREQEVNIPNR